MVPRWQLPRAHVWRHCAGLTAQWLAFNGTTHNVPAPACFPNRWTLRAPARRPSVGGTPPLLYRRGCSTPDRRLEHCEVMRRRCTPGRRRRLDGADLCADDLRRRVGRDLLLADKPGRARQAASACGAAVPSPGEPDGRRLQRRCASIAACVVNCAAASVMHLSQARDTGYYGIDTHPIPYPTDYTAEQSCHMGGLAPLRLRSDGMTALAVGVARVPSGVHITAAPKALAQDPRDTRCRGSDAARTWSRRGTASRTGGAP